MRGKVRCKHIDKFGTKCDNIKINKITLLRRIFGFTCPEYRSLSMTCEFADRPKRPKVNPGPSKSTK